MKTLMTFITALSLSMGLATATYAHCGGCGTGAEKTLKKDCAAQCKDSKDKDCATKCAAAHKKGHKK